MEDTPSVTRVELDIFPESLDIPLDDVDISSVPLDVLDALNASSDAMAASLDGVASPSASSDAVPASSNDVDTSSTPLDSVRRSSRLAAKPASAAPSYVVDSSSADEDAAPPAVVYAAPPAVVDATSPNVEDPVITAGTPATGRRKYIIKPMFTPIKLYKVSQLYRKAVYDNVEIPAKKKAVMAVLYHTLDHQESSLEDKVRYHQHCGDWCYFVQWQNTDEPLEDFKKTTTKDTSGNIVPWTGGVYAKLDIDYPDAFKKLENFFVGLGNDELMSRTTTVATQNINESVHQKLWCLCRKSKKHTCPRYNFACEHVAMEHNFGKVKASLYNIIGGMNYDARNSLQQNDKDSIGVAKRKHDISETGARQNRKKRMYNPQAAYNPGGEDLQGDM